jgi:nondiscriminating aspartyl-tRNA synthetase
LSDDSILKRNGACVMAEQECGVPAVFVVGFPLGGRPFYSAPRGNGGAAQVSICSFAALKSAGGQRLSPRGSKARCWRAVSIRRFCRSFADISNSLCRHTAGLRLAERLTMQVLSLANVREPFSIRDRDRLAP